MGKNLPANAGDAGHAGSIPGSERSPEEHSNRSSILAWRIPRTEEPGGLQSMRSQSQTRLSDQTTTTTTLYTALSRGQTWFYIFITSSSLHIHPVRWMPVLSHFTEEETEAQRGEVLWLRVVDSRLSLQTCRGNLSLPPSSSSSDLSRGLQLGRG